MYLCITIIKQITRSSTIKNFIALWQKLVWRSSQKSSITFQITRKSLFITNIALSMVIVIMRSMTLTKSFLTWLLGGKEPIEICRATFFGNIKSWSDEYIRFNAYGNLESVSEYDAVEKAEGYIEDIYDYEDVWEDYIEPEEEDEDEDDEEE